MHYITKARQEGLCKTGQGPLKIWTEHFKLLTTLCELFEVHEIYFQSTNGTVWVTDIEPTSGQFEYINKYRLPSHTYLDIWVYKRVQVAISYSFI